MIERILHSFEAGRRGKPDEFDTGVANLIGAYLLELNPLTRFDLRVSGTMYENKPFMRVSGEISNFALRDLCLTNNISKIILDRYNFVHRSELQPEDIIFEYNFKPQSHNLASNGNAGDSGNPIAVAYANSPNYLPWERHLAVELRDIFDQIYYGNGIIRPDIGRRSGLEELKGLRPDGKVSVEALYEGSQLHSLTNITLATEHEETLSIDELRDKGNRLITNCLTMLGEQYSCFLGNPLIIINGAGAWHKGGYSVDEGNREAKPYRDGFASYGVQEDSFGGEDPTKPSGTGTFIARYIAVQVVANHLAEFARVASSYTLGQQDAGLNIFTQGTGKISQNELETMVREKLPLTVKDGIKAFNLRNPQLYQQIVANSDYFHNPTLPWNVVRRDLLK